ncbi:MAG: hypothetical protein K2X87_09515 [Gemmataceae bacterium]|nr:hypothetical protein [Gemmataceae bacterium]
MQYVVILVCLLALLIFGVLPGGCVTAVTEGLGAAVAYVFWGFVILCVLGGLSSRK